MATATTTPEKAPLIALILVFVNEKMDCCLLLLVAWFFIFFLNQNATKKMRSKQIFKATWHNFTKATTTFFPTCTATYSTNNNNNGSNKTIPKNAKDAAALVTRKSTFQPTPFSHPFLFDHSVVNPVTLSPWVVPGFDQAEFAQRRSKLFALMQPGSLCLVPSNVVQYMTHDIPYVFRQHSNLYYATGCCEPHACLLMAKDAQGNGEVLLFVREKNDKYELWNGPCNGVEQSRQLFGIKQVYDLDGQMEQELHRMLQQIKNAAPITLYLPSSWINMIQQQQPQAYDVALSQHVAFSILYEQLLATLQNTKCTLHNVHTQLFTPLRAVKTAQEVAHIRKAAQISATAYHITMSHTQLLQNESQLDGMYEYVVRMLGAQRHAYPPVVASGERANITHYVLNHCELPQGKLICMDGACEYYMYPNDITRTWPISGKFTAAQKSLYQLVLDVQEACIAFVRNSMTQRQRISLHHVHEHSLRMFLKLWTKYANSASDGALLQAPSMSLLTVLYPHSIGHPCGLDIHDDGPQYFDSLAPGNMITIEPGLYIPVHLSDDLKQCVPEAWQGMGIRIEDDLFIDEQYKVHVLTEQCVKQVDQIEQLTMGKPLDWQTYKL